jgi:hypothetical protein
MKPPRLVTRRRRQMKLENLHQKQFWDRGWRLETIHRYKRGLLHCISDARAYPIPGRTLGRSHHKDRRQRPQPRVEQRVITDEVVADDMGSGAVSAVPNNRHSLWTYTSPCPTGQQSKMSSAHTGPICRPRISLA